MERALEELVWQRAGGRCEYCQLSQADLNLPFEVDHIVAEHHQGRTQASYRGEPPDLSSILVSPSEALF